MVAMNKTFTEKILNLATHDYFSPVNATILFGRRMWRLTKILHAGWDGLAAAEKRAFDEAKL